MEIANKILTIPLSRCNQSDHWIWRGDNIDNYSVKSEYRWLEAKDASAIDEQDELHKLFFTKNMKPKSS